MTLCRQVHQFINGKAQFGFPFNAADIPRNGIYYLFERGETAHGLPRIVRVGTHTGNNQLPSRLLQHFLLENKDRSIFRKNIGRALLRQNNDPYATVWEYDLTSRTGKEKFGPFVDSVKQRQIEQQVSDFIRQNFTFTVIELPLKADRLYLETRLLSMLAACPECNASKTWLGNHSPVAKIAASGLWNVQGIYKEPLNTADFEKYFQPL